MVDDYLGGLARRRLAACSLVAAIILMAGFGSNSADADVCLRFEPARASLIGRFELIDDRGRQYVVMHLDQAIRTVGDADYAAETGVRDVEITDQSGRVPADLSNLRGTAVGRLYHRSGANEHTPVLMMVTGVEKHS